MRIEKFKIVDGNGTDNFISLKNSKDVRVIINTQNATGVVKADFELKQAANVMGENAKTLAFDSVLVCNDSEVSDTYVEIPVVDNKFSANTTVSKNFTYLVDINYHNLDSMNIFDCIGVDVANVGNTEVSVIYMIDSQYTPDKTSFKVD